MWFIMVGVGLQVTLFMEGHSYWCHLSATPKHGNWYPLACDIRKVTWWIAFRVLLSDLRKRWKSYSSTGRFVTLTLLGYQIKITQVPITLFHLFVPYIKSSFGYIMSPLTTDTTMFNESQPSSITQQKTNKPHS